MTVTKQSMTCLQEKLKSYEIESEQFKKSIMERDAAVKAVFACLVDVKKISFNRSIKMAFVQI